jgi:branched-subunit amino acid aminotransferase/4-amino-4-deoxychorismate lyase
MTISLDAIPLEDRGFLLGDGLFETVLWRDGAPMFWDEHMDRLRRGCQTLGLPAPDPKALLAAVRAEADGLAQAAVRLTWTAGSGGRGLDRPASLTPGLAVRASASAPPAGPAMLVTSTVRRNEASPASRLKSLSYLDNVLARREALAAGADEAVMLNTRGEVACAAAANLFWITDGELFTSSLDCGVLDGIVRGKLVEALPVKEVRISADGLKRAEAVFLTNSLIGMRWASHLDGRPLGQPEEVQVQVGQVIWDERRGRK